MVFNRWFWFSVLTSIFAQSIHWQPALAAEELFPEPKHADWICYHSDSSIRSYGREPAIVEVVEKGNRLTPEFLAWASEFSKRLEKTLKVQHL